MARTGLRMMPTFPSSPLRFRTAGFPQYGSKAGLSSEVFPQGTCCPDVVYFRSSYSAGCAGSLRSESEPAPCSSTAKPQGPSLRSGLCCPGPSLLIGPIRPTRRHSETSPPCDLYPLPSLYPTGLSDLRVVPCFHCCSFSACRPLRPRGVHRLHTPSFFADDAGLHRASNCSALPTPHHPLPVGLPFRGSIGSLALRPVELLASLADPTGVSSSRQRRLLSGFRRVGHPSRRRV